jgi:hypothetical protein
MDKSKNDTNSYKNQFLNSNLSEFRSDMSTNREKNNLL